jgi:mono/diheme cytochrome c family protein
MTTSFFVAFCGAVLALAGSLASAAQIPSTTWQGVYSSDEAAKGKSKYTEYCAGCHMDDLSGGGPAPALTGDAFLAQNEKRTVADLFTRIKTTMPPDQPEQLGDDTYLQLVAFLLQQAGFPAGPAALPTQLEALQQIKITPKKTGRE